MWDLIRWLFSRSPKKGQRSLTTATQAWEQDYRGWLDDLQRVFGQFPDHAHFEGIRVDEKTARLLNEVVRLYTEDACRIVEQFVLLDENLKRHIDKQEIR